MRKKWFLLIFYAGSVLAQTDAPPELEQPLAPDELPSLDVPAGNKNEKLSVEFIGNMAFHDRQLRDGIALQIESIEDFGLDEPGAYDAAFFLESFYRKNGYAQAGVRPMITGPWSLQLTVDENQAFRLGAINIRGNGGFDADTLTGYLLGPLRERFPRVRVDSALPFVESDIFSGVELLRRLYASTGYLDAVIDIPEIQYDDDDAIVHVNVTVEEGIQYRFGKILFLGDIIVSQEDLRAIVAEQTQDIFTDGRLAAAARALEDFYVRRGYFNATVDVDGEPSSAISGVVPVTFRVTLGKLHRFDGIVIEGTEGVNPSFIEKRMRRLSGKVYDPALIDKSFRELIQTGLFRNLRITPEAVGDDGINLNVSVTEALPKEFGFGLGYASFYGGIVSASYRDLNFLRSGRPLNIQFEVNQRGFSGEALYTDPWLFDTDYQLRLRLYALSADLKGYGKNEVGFQPSLTRFLTESWQVSGFVTAKYVKLRDVEITPISLVGRQDYSVFSLGVSQTLDYRNNPALPTRGFIFSTSFEVAPNGVGDVAFARGLASLSWYVPITAKSTLALGARAGILSPLSDQGIPIDERFFNGGATTVRSFSELTLGPRDRAGYPLGGQARTIFNAEYTFPLIGDLYGAVFADAGNVISEVAHFGMEDMRYAVGGGLRYNLPIGAVRFDYGLNPSPRQGEAQGAFHFAIGVAF